jgi:hypothetical protein
VPPGRTLGDVVRRADDVTRFLPKFWKTAEAILG